MKQTKNIRLFILLLTCFQVLYSAHSCDTFPASSATAPPLPLIPDKFSTRIEINLDGKIGSDVHVNFDYNRRKAAIVIQTKNLETKLVFDYPTNEIHVVEMYANYTQGPLMPGDPNRFGSPRFCKSVPLAATSYLNYYFGYNYLNATYIIPNEPIDVMHLNFPQMYNASYVVRGIPCDCYLSCVYRPETKQNYTLEFCFSILNYPLPSITKTYNRLPVRATFTGVTETVNGLQNFTETHDFYDYKPDQVNEEFFQTPPDLVCMDRKKTKETPKPKSHFRFSREESTNGIISYLKDLVYDSDRNLVRLEMRPKTKEKQTFFVTDPLMIINDYNIGVSFNLNRNLKNCSISPISDNSFDEDFNYTASLFNSSTSFVIKLKSPESLLGLDSDYVYTGKRVINNLPADNYVSDRSKIAGTTLTAEYAFTSDGFGFQTTSGMTINIPSTFIQRAPDREYYSYETYYNFDEGDLGSELFDTSACFPKDDQIEIRLKFPYKEFISAEELSKTEEFIRVEIYTTLVGSLLETWTRFSKPKISVSDDGFLYVRTAILPRPPSLTYFTLVPGKWLLTGGLETKYNVTTPDACASYCLENAKCLSFDHSVTSKTCFLNPKHGSQADLSPFSAYNHYSRNTLNGMVSRPSFTLWNVLLNYTKESRITLNIPLQSNLSNLVRLVASDIDQLVDTDDRYGTTSALKKYNKAKPGKKFATIKDSYLLNQNIDDCAHACTDELKYECLSFDFCYISGDCRLSSKYLADIGEASDAFIDSVECDIYEKDPLFHYTEFTAKATVNPKDKNYKVDAPSQCATKCDKETDLHCRSFNYCPESKTCYLSKNHLLDGSEAGSSDLICSHYSRNYLSDFSFTSSGNISLVGDLVYENSNIEACSLLCVTADGFNCKSFNYCPGTKKCLLNSGKKTGKPETTEKDVCSNYIREYFYVTSQNRNTGTSDSSGIVLIILSIAFAIFGSLIGLVSAVLYIKKRRL